MVLLENDQFLTELTKMYERNRESGSVWVTMKRSMMKRLPKRGERPSPPTPQGEFGGRVWDLWRPPAAAAAAADAATTDAAAAAAVNGDGQGGIRCHGLSARIAAGSASQQRVTAAKEHGQAPPPLLIERLHAWLKRAVYEAQAAEGPRYMPGPLQP